MKSFRDILYLFTCIILVSGIISCGGGGGGSSSTPLPPLQTLKTNSVRVIQMGDNWTYSATDVLDNGATTLSLTGTIIIQALNTTKTSPINATVYINQQTTGSWTDSSGTPYNTGGNSYYRQDVSGNMYDSGEGDGATDKWINNPAAGEILSISSPLTVGGSLGGAVTYSDGSTETFSYNVVSTENVLTTAGYYEAYKINLVLTINYVSGSFTKAIITGTIWYVPGLGEVKGSAAISYYNGAPIVLSETMTYSLTSTNVTY